MIVFCVDLDNTLIYSYKHIDRLQSESGPNMAGIKAVQAGMQLRRVVQAKMLSVSGFVWRHIRGGRFPLSAVRRTSC